MYIHALDELWHHLSQLKQNQVFKRLREENVFDDVTHLIVPLSYSLLSVLNRPHYNEFTDTLIAVLPLMELPDPLSGTSKTESLL